jgi:hypothetical protein
VRKYFGGNSLNVMQHHHQHRCRLPHQQSFEVRHQVRLEMETIQGLKDQVMWVMKEVWAMQKE